MKINKEFYYTVEMTTLPLTEILRNDTSVIAVQRSGNTIHFFEPLSCLKKMEYIFSYYFLQASSYLLHALQFKTMSRRAWIASFHAYAPVTAEKMHQVFQRHFLAPSVNTHSKDTAHHYLSPPLSAPSPIFHPNSGQIETFHSRGICRGMCLWFAYLYFCTQNNFPRAEEHLCAVGKQFEKGAGIPAALLQSMTLPPAYRYLNITASEDHTTLSPALSLSDIAEKINALPQGVYAIYTSKHVVLYIKSSGGSFLFDPNRGTVATPTFSLLEMAFGPSLRMHNSNERITIDRYEQTH